MWAVENRESLRHRVKENPLMAYMIKKGTFDWKMDVCELSQTQNPAFASFEY